MPEVSWSLDDRETAMIWWAIYLAYGNEERAGRLWTKFRKAVGKDWEKVIKAGEKIGREDPRETREYA